MAKVKYYTTIVDLETNTVNYFEKDNKADYLALMEKEIGDIHRICLTPVTMDDDSETITAFSSDMRKAVSILVVPVKE